MANKLIECVPNFSEGRNQQIIHAIAEAISSSSGAKLLDVDPGASTNRTVYTFVGTPQACVTAAIEASKVAYRLIDMAKHKGEHPRMGALDVCPFVPLSPEDMPLCIEASKQFGKRLAEELGVSVFLYNESVTEESRQYRKSMPQIRAGEYEAFIEGKMNNPEWKPDYGPPQVVPCWGATVTGARKFLIAYNVNLIGTKEQAHRIALNIREQGRSANEPGRLRKVQAIGWYLDEANLAQISTNIVDLEVTRIHEVFEESKKDAAEMKVAITGSELVGLVPLRALLDCAEFYMQKEGLMVLEESQKIRLAVERLGLSSIKHFQPEERIIEYLVGANTLGKLAKLPVCDFVKQVAARVPIPGGGSVSALVGALGASLATMAALLTFGNRKFQSLDGKMRKLIPEFHSSIGKILPMIDADSDSFSEYIQANRELTATKRSGDAVRIEECSVKVSEAAKNSVKVPMTVVLELDNLWKSLTSLAESVNPATTSDLRVSAYCLATAIHGAHANVNINLPNLLPGDEDVEFEENLKKAHEADMNVEKNLDAVLKSLPDA